MPTQRQRRQAERRRLQRQAERRTRRARRRRQFTMLASIAGTLIVTAIVVVFVVATGDDNTTPTKPAAATKTPTPSATATSPATSAAISAATSGATSGATSTAASYPCTWTQGGTAARKVKLPTTTTPPKTGTVTVSVTTDRGPMTFTLDRKLAPCTVASFVSLVEQHYYDTTPCHRLTTSGIYVLQCGDPTGTGTGGPGYTIPDEATGSEKYPAGTIAMARSSQAHSGGSQFFIVYRDSPNLEQHLGKLQYTVFGKVSHGLSVVNAVAAKGADPSGDGKPKLPISLKTVRIGK